MACGCATGTAGLTSTVFDYWKKIFAVVFGMGVVSGIVMSYQFGTNWACFSDKAGPVIGPLMGYEVLTAFFLEAGFLGVMLFGRERVGPGLHFFATLMVAVGTLISAFWILAANSWMQTPAGYAINAAGQFVAGRLVDDHLQSVLPVPPRPHGARGLPDDGLRRSAAVGAWHLLRDRANRRRTTMFSMAMWMAALVAPIQILAGDPHGLNTLEYQPAKIAAMEGHFETEPATPLILFGMPDMARRRRTNTRSRSPTSAA